jgi:hypothetical protein
VAKQAEPWPVLGGYDDAAEVVSEHRVDVLLLAFSLQDQHHAAGVVTGCRGLPVDIELVPDTVQLLSRRARVREIDGLPILALREFPLTGWNVVAKRTFDIALTGLGLVPLAPLMLTVALLVKLTSKGPVFYRQERLGRDGRRFDILKFRSMQLDAERTSGPV